tara:strand:- start:43 stop:645 length:603 start_codon:yes stop_codon:yes gene_type:complete
MENATKLDYTYSEFNGINKPQLIKDLLMPWQEKLRESADSKLAESEVDLTRTNANNMTVGLINKVLKMTYKSGDVVPNGFKIPVKQSADIALGDGTFEKVVVQETWFTAWDDDKTGSTIGSELFKYAADNEHIVVRLYWKWSAKRSEVTDVPMTHKVTREDGTSGYEPLLDENGNTRTRKGFGYPPSKVITAFDLLSPKQ